jgi:hypothetical protein
MDIKKDIYEHLADIYLDASYKSKSKQKPKYHLRFKNLAFIGIAIISVPTIFLFTALNRQPSSSALILQPRIVTINLNTSSPQSEIHSINLDRKDLSRYKTLAFSVRKDSTYQPRLTLRVKLTSAQKQKSEMYLDPISSQWSEYTLKLNDFQSINSWSKMLNLSFIIDEHNVSTNEKPQSGAVYIDNVRLLR